MEKNEGLRERLLDFAVSVIKLGERPPRTAEGRHVIAQLMRSGTAAAITFCRAELELIRPNHTDGLWRVLGALKEAETLVEKIVEQANAQDVAMGSFERDSKELRGLMETKVRTAMEELCGGTGCNARGNM